MPCQLRSHHRHRRHHCRCSCSHAIPTAGGHCCLCLSFDYLWYIFGDSGQFCTGAQVGCHLALNPELCS
jgi:hypothetical protein